MRQRHPGALVLTRCCRLRGLITKSGLAELEALLCLPPPVFTGHPADLARVAAEEWGSLGSDPGRADTRSEARGSLPAAPPHPSSLL